MVKNRNVIPDSAPIRKSTDANTSMRLSKLEALRGFACVYVVAYHSRSFQSVSWFFGYGSIAVMVFFILSGFVISYSTFRLKRPTFRDYLRRRIRRIYPIFIAALVFTYVTNCVVTQTFAPIQIKVLIGNLLMLQDSGTVGRKLGVEPFGANTPLWSLAYEWWFYMA